MEFTFELFKYLFIYIRTIDDYSLLVTDSPLDLTTIVSPTGGTFSGTGVSGTTFDPAVAGVGTHTVTYSYESFNDGVSTPCQTEITAQIVVMPVAGNLVCIGHINLSLGNDCTALLLSDMFETTGAPGATVVWSTSLIGVQAITTATPLNTTVGSAQCGQTLYYKVFNGSNACWGTFKVEDKIAPAIACTPTSVICPVASELIDLFNMVNYGIIIAIITYIFSSSTNFNCSFLW